MSFDADDLGFPGSGRSPPLRTDRGGVGIHGPGGVGIHTAGPSQSSRVTHTP